MALLNLGLRQVVPVEIGQSNRMKMALRPKLNPRWFFRASNPMCPTLGYAIDNAIETASKPWPCVDDRHGRHAQTSRIGRGITPLGVPISR